MRLSVQAPIKALRQLGVLPAIVSLFLILPVASAQAETLLKVAGTLSAIDDSRLEDGSLYDDHKFIGSSGQQVTIILESREFDPYLILIDPNGERIDENDDISRTNLNSRLVIVLPSTGTYTIYANSYDATKSGQYNITVRTNDRSIFPANLSAFLVDSSAQCTAEIKAAIQTVEADRDIRVLPSLFQLINQYEDIPEGKPDGVEMNLSGTATQSVMASSQLIRQVAGGIIQNCTSIGLVAFKPEAYPEERIFGYSPTRAFNAPQDLPVEEFNCAITVSDSPSEQRSPWGQKRCP